MPVKFNGATSGFVQLAAPAVAGSTSLVLPTDSVQPGLVLVAVSSFSAASTVSVDNCFTSTYDNYRVITDFTAASTALTITMRMRVGGADSSAASYTRQILYGTGATVTAGVSTGATSWSLVTSDATYMPYNRFAFDLYGPQLTRITTGTYNVALYESTGLHYSMSNAVTFAATTSFDGFSLIASTGNFNCTVRVYGYRNSITT